VGCLLAAQASCAVAGDVRLLFWQPQLQGRQALQQFLRVKMASQLQQGGHRGVVDELRRELEQGRSVEVAGYVLGAGIASGLGAAQCTTPPSRTPVDVTWIDLSSQSPPIATPASVAAVERWRHAGWDVQFELIHGPLYWQSAWLEEVPELAHRTAELLGDERARAV
jgi:hypothetical protein